MIASYYKNAHAYMVRKGKESGFDFDNPETHASTDTEWRHMTTEFMFAANSGSGRKQYEARVRFYIKHYERKCRKIRNDDARAKVASFLNFLVECGGTNKWKRRYRGGLN